MAKKLTLGLILARFGSNWFPKSFLCGFNIYYMLYFVASYHCMPFQGKIMNQTWKVANILVLELILVPLAHILAPKILFHEFSLYEMLYIVVNYHCMQFQGKLMNQTWENDKKISFGIDFGPNSGRQLFFQKSESVCYKKAWSAIIMYNIIKN